MFKWWDEIKYLMWPSFWLILIRVITCFPMDLLSFVITSRTPLLACKKKHWNDYCPSCTAWNVSQMFDTVHTWTNRRPWYYHISAFAFQELSCSINVEEIYMMEKKIFLRCSFFLKNGPWLAEECLRSVHNYYLYWFWNFSFLSYLSWIVSNIKGNKGILYDFFKCMLFNLL